MVLVLSLVSFHNLLLLDGVCTPLEEQKPVSTKICSLLIGIRNSVQFRKISNPGMSYAWSIILSLLQKYTALLFSKNQLNILVLRCRTYQISNKHGAVSNYTGQQRFCSMRKNVYFWSIFGRWIQIWFQNFSITHTFHSRLKGWNLLHQDTKVCFYRGCHEEFKDFFSQEDGVIFCNDVCSIMEVLGQIITHISGACSMIRQKWAWRWF